MAATADWIKAFRLRTLPLSISGILVGGMAALPSPHWNGLVFGLAFVTTLLFQILSNLANDLGDSQKGADNADRIGPMRAVQSGAISLSAMKRAVILTAVLSLASAFSLIYLGVKTLPTSFIWGYIGLAFACVFAAITYTVGKKAYGYNGLGDIFVFTFFGVVSVVGVYPLLAQEINWNLLFPATAIGLLSTAVLNLNNMRDQVNDAAVEKRTLVVKLGFKGAKIYHYVLLKIALLSWIVFLYQSHIPLAWISLLPFGIIAVHGFKVMRTTEPKDFDPELKKIALSTFFIALIYTICSCL